MPSRLQAELKQTKPFPRRSAEALLSVMRTAALIEHHLNEALRPHGLTATQYNVLRILRGAGANGLCGREVAARMVSRVPDVSRLLERMEDMGLISRERDSADRRHVTARITARGLAILGQVAPVLEEVERARVGRLGAERLQDLIDGLAALREGG